MPAASNIVINDGAVAPVAHTFTPIGKDDKGILWYEQTVPVPVNPLGAKRIGYKQNRAVDPSGKRLNLAGTASYMLFLPTLEVLGVSDTGITPPPTLAYREVARMSFELSERSVKQERKDTRVLMANLLAHSSVVTNVDDLQVTY